MRWLVLIVMLLLAPAAWAQDKAPPPVRSAVLAWQQMGASLESLSGYYEARIEELKRLCGDPCKDK